MARKTRTKAHYTDIFDCPSNLSKYEKDSLASEAKLKAEREKPYFQPRNPKTVAHAPRTKHTSFTPQTAPLPNFSGDGKHDVRGNLKT
ncbi:MAG: hypothetical protein JWQ87_4756 [Candidatus Sulfotelmatobacter sp.]|nr:hypothetical protein [Candidatus Sulfotelmatobacter sp.]